MVNIANNNLCDCNDVWENPFTELLRNDEKLLQYGQAETSED